MKHCFSIIILLLSGLFSNGQDLPIVTEQQLENLADAGDTETEDDSYLQELEQFRKRPVNINTAEAAELRQLRILSDLQIANLVAYRGLLGSLLNVYELQAIPTFDISTIKKILPFVTTASALSLKETAFVRFKEGEHSLLTRVSQVLEKSDGFNPNVAGTKYTGSPQRIFFRYRYQYKNLLQYGISGDKDAGEQFFKGAQRNGFDFYSFHLFTRKMGIVQALAVGDFTVNMGQGLVHWQSMAFKKSADVLNIKRQSAVLRPYSSAGEYYFHRGAGVTLRKGKMELTVFGSVRKLSANFATDTINNEDFISSFLTSGYNRTANEINDRNKLRQTTMGGNFSFKHTKWQAGLSIAGYHFSAPLQKRNEPYNLYAISGSSWLNMSVDYSYTYKNLHFFGEAAIDKQLDKAFINGLLVSIDPRVDISLLYRHIEAAYQSVYGNAFSENALPSNEHGFFIGTVIRPAIGWRIDLYADVYKFPWLKYQVDAPSRGADFLAQINYTPNKQVELYTRFRSERKEANGPGNTTGTNFLVYLPRQSWRTHLNYRISKTATVRSRAELLWYDKNGMRKENGFLLLADYIYKPMLSRFSGALRLQYFETDGYASRIYAYENDVAYSYSIPALYDKGLRYYLTINYDVSKKFSIWFRIAQTCYKNLQSVGSGPDKIPGNQRSELKFQALWSF